MLKKDYENIIKCLVEYIIKFEVLAGYVPTQKAKEKDNE